MATTDTDVLIVGAGPVGLVLATDLVRRGVAVRIIDELAAPTTESRAIAVHSRSLDHLEALGVFDAVMSRAVEAKGMAFHAEGRDIGYASFEHIIAVHRFSAALPQTDLEAVLTERLRRLGLEVERATTLTGFTEDAEGVDAAVTGAEGAPSRIRARFLVGTDGARSTVRHIIGERLDGQFTGDDFLLGDVEAEYDYDRSSFHTFFSPGPTTGLLFPLPGDRVRVFAQLPPGTDPDREVTQEWMQQALLERGVQLSIRRSHWLSRFELKHGQVARYRSGRAFLAGDAAHIHSPAGALGMNTGIQDAVNLGWKLAAVVAGQGGEALLESYHAERHPIGASVIEFTNRLSAVGTLANPVGQRIRNMLLHVGLEHTGVGEVMAGVVEQQTVRYRDSDIVQGRGDKVHPGDFLYLPHTRMADALGRSTGHVAIVLPGGETTDVLPQIEVTDAEAASLAQATRRQHGGVIAVRPDGYVGYIGDANGLTGYLRALRD